MDRIGWMFVGAMLLIAVWGMIPAPPGAATGPSEPTEQQLRITELKARINLIEKQLEQIKATAKE